MGDGEGERPTTTPFRGFHSWRGTDAPDDLSGSFEVFYEPGFAGQPLDPGWYWRACFPDHPRDSGAADGMPLDELLGPGRGLDGPFKAIWRGVFGHPRDGDANGPFKTAEGGLPRRDGMGA
jgi:hypothetical protein